MIPRNDKKYTYKGSSGDSIEGPNAASCIDQLKQSSHVNDNFFLSADETTISHHREGGLIDVLRRIDD